MKRKEKYQDFYKLEQYDEQPFNEITGIAEAFLRPKEMLLQPVCDEHGFPKRVDDGGSTLLLGRKYMGKGKTLDRRQYIKVFTELLPLIYSGKISLPATKLLFYIMDRLKPESDIVMINLKIAASRMGYKTDKSVYEGLVDLIKLGIIARKTETAEQFWVNPQYIFRGDRVKMLNSKENDN